jgi:hypothetical protein
MFLAGALLEKPRKIEALHAGTTVTTGQRHLGGHLPTV